MDLVRLSQSGRVSLERASKHILAVVCGYPSSDRKDKGLLMLVAHLDESGSSEKDKELVLAGYVQSATVWTSFSDDWKSILDGSPAIPYFHMSEAESKKGVFEGWDQKDIRRKTSELADLIAKYDLWSVECRVSVTAFDRILRPVAPFDLKNPYIYLFAGIVDSLASMQDQTGINEAVDIVMDNHEASRFVTAYYPVLKVNLSPELSKFLGDSPIFRDDKKVVPLQAADMLAWHLRRAREPRNARERGRIHAKLLPRLHVARHVTPALLTTMAEHMLAVPDLAEVQDRRGSLVLPPLPPPKDKPIRRLD